MDQHVVYHFGDLVEYPNQPIYTEQGPSPKRAPVPKHIYWPWRIEREERIAKQRLEEAQQSAKQQPAERSTNKREGENDTRENNHDILRRRIAAYAREQRTLGGYTDSDSYQMRLHQIVEHARWKMLFDAGVAET